MKLSLEKRECSFLKDSPEKIEELLKKKQIALQKDWGKQAIPIHITETKDMVKVTFMKCPSVDDVVNEYAMKDRAPKKKDTRVKNGCFYYPSNRVSIPGVGVMDEAEMKLQIAQGKLKHIKKGGLDYWMRVIK